MVDGASGAVLQIPKKLLDDIRDADSAIVKLAETSENTQKRIKKAFEDMANNVNPLKTALTEMATAMGAIDNKKLSNAVDAMSETASATERAATAAKVLKSNYNEAASSISKAAQNINAGASSVRAKNVGQSAQATQNQSAYDTTKAALEGSSTRINAINAEIEAVKRKKQALIDYNREYQAFIKQGGTSNYRPDTSMFSVYDQQIKKLREERQAIIDSDNAMMKKQQTAASLAHTSSVSLQDIRNMQQQEAEMKRLNDWYRELEKESEKNAAKAERDREREAKAAERAAERERIAAKNAGVSLGSYRDLKGGNTNAAITYANQAKNVTQLAQAINFLTTARDKENMKTAEGQQRIRTLNDAIRRHTEELRKAKGQSDNLHNSHSKLMNTTEQLSRKFALLFSVSQIQGYINKLVSVRGEFEIQQRSLEAILQNKSQADQIFNKTVALAVKSPFRIKELVSYTKQLAAYRIEGNKLYDTTKRLADVSAGLGVDMQRLILAYGQVKAAAYLRGTEVRQFTEAGINLYGELQSYFKEVKGEAYTTAQIVDMISKRKVAFEDIEAIFQRLTDKGGLFYNMQEIQAETLQGKVSNLHDQIDVMLNDIGKDSEGILKGTIDGIGALVKSWQTVMEVGKAFAALILTIYINNKMAGKSFAELAVKGSGSLNQVSFHAARTAVSIKYVGHQLGFLALKFPKTAAVVSVGLKKMANGIKILGNAIKGMAIFAILDAAYEIYNTIAKSNKLLADSTNTYYKARIKIDGFNKTAKTDIRKALDDLVKEMNQDGFSITLDPNLSTDKAKEKYKEYLKDYEQFQEEMREIGARYAENKKKGWTPFGGFDDDIDTDSDEYEESLGKFLSTGDKIPVLLKKIATESSTLSSENRKLLDELSQGAQASESTEAYYTRIANAINEVTGNINTADFSWGVSTDDVDKLDSFIKNFGTMKGDAEEVKREVIEIFGALDDPKNQDKEKLRIRIDKYAADHEIDDVKKQLYYQTYDIPIKADDDSIKNTVKQVDEAIKTLLGEKSYSINVKVKLTELDALNKDVDDYIKERNKAKKELEQLNKGNTSFLSEATAVITDPVSGQQFRVPKEDWGKNLEALKQERVNKIAELDKLIIASGRGDELDKKEKKKAASDAERPRKEAERREAELWQSRIDVIEKMGARYEKLRELYSVGEASEKTKEAFADAMREVNMPTDIIDPRYFVPDKQSIIDALQRVYNSLPNTEPSNKKRDDIQEKRGVLITEKDVKESERNLEILKRDVDRMFDSLDLHDKMSDLGLHNFEIDKVFPGLRKSFAQMREELDKKFGVTGGYKDMNDADLILNLPTGEKYAKAYIEARDKINQKEVDHNKQTMEQLVKDYKNKLDDQLQIDLWYVRERKKIQDTVTDQALAKEMNSNLEKQYNQKTSEQAWKDFQESDYYIKLFEDLDSVSGRVLFSMHSRLSALRNDLKDLQPSQVRAIAKQMETLEDALNKKDPLGSMIRGTKEYLKFLTHRAKLEKELANHQAQQDLLEQEKRELGLQVEQAKNEMDNAQSKQEFDAAAKNLSIARRNYELVLRRLKAEKAVTDNLANQVRAGEKAHSKAKDGYEATKDLFSKLGTQAKELASYWDDDVADAIGNSVDNVIKVADAVYSVMDSISQATETFTTQISVVAKASADGSKLSAEVTSKSMSTLEKASAILAIISAAIQLATAVASLLNKDSKKQKEIEKLQAQIQELQWSYERLKKSMDDAWDTASLINYKDAAVENLRAQQASYEAMAKAERDKKKTDASKAAEYERNAKEIEETIKELSESMTEQLGGFGSEANYKSAAEAFADAWVDAFNEGSDTLDALTDKFDEYFDNLIKKQVMMRASARFIEPILKAVDEAVSEGSEGGNNGAEVTQNEIDKIKRLKEENLEGYDDYVHKLMDILGISPRSDASLSALQQGIQGVTENTAQALESILNSMRWFLSTQQNDVAIIKGYLADHFGDGATTSGESPMLNELKAQTQLIRSINSSLSDVIISQARTGGKGIKVYMD